MKNQGSPILVRHYSDFHQNFISSPLSEFQNSLGSVDDYSFEAQLSSGLPLGSVNPTAFLGSPLSEEDANKQITDIVESINS
ncbi:hypothetical protein [Capybara microvirus Cap3_SP_319]|nr:hypothetical protein [Capybara microvirus Cap3_SP_319]